MKFTKKGFHTWYKGTVGGLSVVWTIDANLDIELGFVLPIKDCCIGVGYAYAGGKLVFVLLIITVFF